MSGWAPPVDRPVGAHLHVRLLSGSNDHHRVEAPFKALARALRSAVTIDNRIADQVPSTKEVL